MSVFASKCSAWFQRHRKSCCWFFSGLGFHMSRAETASKEHASGFTRHHPATFFPRPQLDWDRGCLKSHTLIRLTLLFTWSKYIPGQHLLNWKLVTFPSREGVSEKLGQGKTPVSMYIDCATVFSLWLIFLINAKKGQWTVYLKEL